MWKESFKHIPTVYKYLNVFIDNGAIESFGKFLDSLENHLIKECSSRKVWIIVDEVVEFLNCDFAIDLPEEQKNHLLIGLSREVLVLVLGLQNLI